MRRSPTRGRARASTSSTTASTHARCSPSAPSIVARGNRRATSSASSVSDSPKATRHTPRSVRGDNEPAQRRVGQRVADRLAGRPASGLRRRHAEQVVRALVDAARRPEAGCGDGRRDVRAVGQLPAQLVGSAGVEVGVRREPDRRDERAAQVPGRHVRGCCELAERGRPRAGVDRVVDGGGGCGDGSGDGFGQHHARAPRQLADRSLAVYGAPSARFHPNSALCRHAPRYPGVTENSEGALPRPAVQKEVSQ